MSAPVSQTQYKLETWRHNILKFTKGLEMKISTRIRNAKRWVLAGFATVTPWKVGRALTLVALLAIGTTLYFSVSQGDALSPSANSETARAFQEGQDYQESMAYLHITGGGVPFDGRYPFGVLTAEQVPEGTMPTKETLDREDVVRIFGEDVVEVLGYEVLATRLVQYQADGSLTSRDLERLNHEVDLLLLAAMEPR